MEKKTPIREKLCDDIKPLTIKEPLTSEYGLLPELRVLFDRIVQKQKNGEPLTMFEKQIATFTIKLAKFKEKLESES